MSDSAEQKKVYYKFDEVTKAVSDQDEKNLRCLYKEHSERMRHDGAQIWIIGTIFIPFSLTGIVFGLGDPLRVIPVAVFSIVLIWIWYYISYRIRVELDKDLAVCAVIESELLDMDSPMIRSGLCELVEPLYEVKGYSLFRLRYLIAILVTLLWIIFSIISIIVHIGYFFGELLSLYT